jgi:hypothetical protein
VCYQTRPIFCSTPFRELLDEMPGLGRLDVLIAGAVYADERGKRLPVYQQHRDAGFLGARAIGMTFHDRPAALAAIRDRQVDIAFIRYNPDHAGADKDVFPYLRPLSYRSRPLLFSFKSTFGYVPPAEMDGMGLHGSVYWHPEITDHYRFVLSRPEIDGVLMAPRTPAELQGIADAIARAPLTEEEQAFLRNIALVARGEAKVERREQVFA